ncbi:MAG TPA: acylneuraminate cytidylyltransferase [Candidatus Nanoarchaeia archaeon]|nr:acylneuraminate cytidylyltransferase [Candidatus Nanoarchaeia archaeon]
MRKLVAALACRIKGSRLYGKPLQNLDIEKGITILDFQISTLKAIRCIKEIILGIADGKDNQAFIEFAQERKLKYIVGDEDDVLGRLIKCGESVGATDLFRVTTESPFIHYEPIEKAWKSHVEGNFDATFCDKVPDSSNFEIVSLAALQKSHTDGQRKHKSELVTSYIRENKDKFTIRYIDIPQELQRKDIRITVDYPEDLILCREVYNHFKGKSPLIPISDIVHYLDTRKDLLEMVAPFCEEGYATMYK